MVADPAFKQIFEPYIKSPSVELPSFITTDSAWHTYHVLLEEGVKELEEIQSRRLARFSHELWAAAKESRAKAPAAGGDLAWFASVGLALQDTQHCKTLSPEEKRIVQELRTGSTEVQVPIGFALSPALFRAQSFYAQSPELSDYFAARQWYASVVFRLCNLRETRLALALAAVVADKPELLELWQQLSDPLDQLLAPAEDGTVRIYAEAAKAVLGTNWLDSSAVESHIREIQKALDSRVPDPRVNDQLLQPEEYADFANQTRGFRLLPPRRLPCAVCFHQTVDPKIRGRMYPSGLDFLAASPVLRSPAAVRALQTQFGNSVSEAILKADCGPMPDSLHGEAMQLLSRLQEPLPEKVAAALRTDAWSDLQLWSQLGAWAEQRHTWALHTKLSVYLLGVVTPPRGMVAPYPAFFSGLAKLSRRTGEALEKARLDQPFDFPHAASEQLPQITLSRHPPEPKDEKELGRISGKVEQVAQLLKDFTPVCERLAELGTKSRTGQALTEAEAKWIEQYGITLARFHFYYGDSFEVPNDDFPIVTRVFSNPLTSAMLYAGLARPQALYVLVPSADGLQLYRGAVMTYREFVRPNDQLLDDGSWRELISRGGTPPAPPFTRSFYAERTVEEWLKLLRARAAGREGYFAAGGQNAEEVLWQLSSVATGKDLPALLDLMLVSLKGHDDDIPRGLAEVIGRLPWEPYQNKLIEMLKSSNPETNDAAAYILLRRPCSLDVAAIAGDFDAQRVRARRVYCVLLGSIPQQTDVTRKVLLQALKSPDAGLRWQAALALGKARWPQDPPTSALLRTLNDTNQYVAAEAVQSLVRLGATNAAPALLTKLQTCLQSGPPTSEETLRQARALMGEPEDPEAGQTWPSPGWSFRGRGDPFEILDPEGVCVDVRLSPPPRAGGMAMRDFPLELRRGYEPEHLGPELTDALVQSLGFMKYQPATEELTKLLGTDHDGAATFALGRVAPDRITDRLLAKACDKQAPTADREVALINLCEWGATNRLRDLAALLEDTTAISHTRMRWHGECQICDITAHTIACLLGWPERLGYSPTPEQRQALVKRAKEWAKTAAP